MLPVAAGANGQPPMPPTDASITVTRLVDAGVACVVEVDAQGDVPGDVPDRGDAGLDVPWVGDADRVGEGDLVDTGCSHPFDDVDEALHRNFTLERIAPGCCDRGRCGDPSFVGVVDDVVEHGDRLVCRHPLVLHVEGVRRHDRHVDLVDTGLGGPQPTTPVHGQADVGHPIDTGNTGHDGFCVGHLGHVLRMGERHGLDALDAGVDQVLDQAELLIRGEDDILVLQAVPRADLDDLDVICHVTPSRDPPGSS